MVLFELDVYVRGLIPFPVPEGNRVADMIEDIMRSSGALRVTNSPSTIANYQGWAIQSAACPPTISFVDYIIRRLSGVLDDVTGAHLPLKIKIHFSYVGDLHASPTQELEFRMLEDAIKTSFEIAGWLTYFIDEQVENFISRGRRGIEYTDTYTLLDRHELQIRSTFFL